MALGALIVAWLVVSEFVAAFQCPTPQTFNFMERKCINKVKYLFRQMKTLS